MSSTIFYNAHHSPIGAFATLTLGCKGPRGGFGLELAGPANESVYIGIEDRERVGAFRALPFYGGAEILAKDYDVEGHTDLSFASAVSCFADREITREMGPGIDTWRAGDLQFRIVSPPRPLQDPESADLRDATAPAILAELTIDNRLGRHPRRAFFGYQGSGRSAGMRVLDEPGLVGVAQGSVIAIATADSDVTAGLGWQPEAILSPTSPENLAFMLGTIGMLVGVVQPGEMRTFRFAIGFFRDGSATTGIRTRYLYRRWFDRVEDVLHHALARADENVSQAERFDAALRTPLSADRAFMLAHAMRSYYGSTQLLEREDGRPLWVVHEGEYRMMNTFDLTVDQAFFELAMNPWTVRNELDLFVERYSYEDDVRFPGSPELHPGGISFTHDMGVANGFARIGRSGYEQSGLNGCFSFMSCEELANWVITAGLYVAHTGDLDWAEQKRDVLLACLGSLENRDHPEDRSRTGVMGLDGARCRGGSEITTYDSLDASLGQARNNLYLAVKCWSAYLLLEKILRQLGEGEAALRARRQAERAAKTIVDSRDENGLMPAVIGEGVDARIIPAIEALVYPFAAGLPKDFPELREALASHLEAVLKPGVCRFDDGGWRLSSTSRNSWLSKIYLCQFVAERLLGYDADRVADRAHVAWLLDADNAYYAWSDQMLEGKAVGSRYYPRGVTSVLWLSNGEQPIRDIARLLTADAVPLAAL